MEKTITTKKPASASKDEKKAAVSQTKTAVFSTKATATATKTAATSTKAPTTSTKTAVTSAKEVNPTAAQAAQPKTAPQEARITLINDESGTIPALAIDSQAVATRAYLLWEQEGYQHGRDREYWLRAEELLKKEHVKKPVKK